MLELEYSKIGINYHFAFSLREKNVELSRIKEGSKIMKEFLDWLHVNEKVARIFVWILIFMVFFLLTNAMLESLGFSNYKITYENLIKINSNKFLDYSTSWIFTILNFYSITLLIFNISETKRMFIYATLYLLLNITAYEIFGYMIGQIFIIIYTISFCFFYSKKKFIYIVYGIISLIFNAFIQYICFASRFNFNDLSILNKTTTYALGLDSFIVMFVVIIIKELFINKLNFKN